MRRYVSGLEKSLPAAVDAKRLASEVGSGPSGLLGGPGGVRSSVAMTKVQVWREPVHVRVVLIATELLSQYKASNKSYLSNFEAQLDRTRASIGSCRACSAAADGRLK